MERTPPVLPSQGLAEAAPAADETPSLEARAEAQAPAKPRLEPTRYGDWELNGKCVDF